MKTRYALIALTLALGMTAWKNEATKKVVFFGDSITQAAVKDRGYIVQMSEMLQQKGITHYQLIGAGIGGNKVYDLYLRMEKDVLDQHPQVAVIYIGVNDVWHKATSRTGTDADKFRKFYQAIIDKMKASQIKPVLCTMAVIGEKKDGTNEQDKELDAYAEIIRQLATANQLPLVDLRKSFMNYYQTQNPDNLSKGILTTDGVHLNEKGNRLVAEEIWQKIAGL